jgi:hypothetical protein
VEALLLEGINGGNSATFTMKDIGMRVINGGLLLCDFQPWIGR